MIIVVGDVHFRSKEPFLTGLHGILQHLISHYKNDTIIFTGDFLHTSSPHWDIIDIAIEYLLQFKQVYIVEGNHDSSYIKGRGLTAFKHRPTVHIIEEKTEVTIEGQNFLLLPHTENVETLKSYEKLTGTYDYVVSHLTHKKVQFRNEGIAFNMRAKAIIHGHIHTQLDFLDDENGNQFNCIIGVPQFVSSGEENQVYRIAKIDGSQPGHGIKFESLPVFTTLETVEYGTMPSNKNNYINVINAPSVPAVKEMYKGYYIRNEGISLKRTQIDEKDIQKVELDFSSKLLEKFIAFAKSKTELPKEVMDSGIHYINLVAPPEEAITDTTV